MRAPDRARAPLVALAGIVVLRLWFAAALEPEANPALVFDDRRFVEHAASILSGHWLGDYDAFTLIKAPGYPMWLAVVGASGVPLLVAEHALYLAAGLALVGAVWPLVGRRRWWVVGAYAWYAFDPVLFSAPLTRTARDLLAASLTVALLAGIAGLLVRRDRRLAAQLPWSLVAGGALGGLAIVREDSIWVVPALLVGLGVHAVSQARRCRSAADLRRVGLVAVPLLLAVVPGLVVSAANDHRYGESTVTDTGDPAYREALDAILSVDVGIDRDFVPLPVEARDALAAASSAFAEIRPGIERFVGTGCLGFEPACDDVTAAHLEWGVRLGADDAGWYASPDEARRRWRALAAEIDAACAGGDLVCRSGSLFTDPDPGRLLGSTASAAASVLVPEIVEPNRKVVAARPESRDAYGEILNEPWTEPGLDDDEIRVVGWALQTDDGSTLAIASVDRGQVRRFERLGSLDVAAAMEAPDAVSSRFDLVIRCPDTCRVELDTGPGPDPLLVIEGSEAGFVGVPQGVETSVDAVSTGSAPGLLQDARLAVLDLWTSVAVWLQLAVTAAVAGVVAVAARHRVGGVATWMPLAVALVLASSRVLLVGVVDATLFPAVSTLYLMPAIAVWYALPIVVVPLADRVVAARSASPGRLAGTGGTGEAGEEVAMAAVGDPVA